MIRFKKTSRQLKKKFKWKTEKVMELTGLKIDIE